MLPQFRWKAPARDDKLTPNMDVLSRIKRLVLLRQIVLTRKAEDEMYTEGLTEDDVIESIVNAPKIAKIIRSTSVYRTSRNEKLYIIKGCTFANVLIYTKGKIVKDADRETFYILISSKRAE